MKKVLAVVLALTMALGMATVAMAATTTHSKPDTIKLDSTIYTLDGKRLTMLEDPSRLDPGKTYYMPVTSNDEAYNKKYENITSVSALSNYRLRPSVSEGRTILGTTEFVVKSITSGNPIDQTKRSNTNCAFIAFTLKESSKATDTELAVDFNVIGTGSYTVDGDGFISLATTVGYGRDDVTGLDFDVKPNKPLINFDECDNEPITIYFLASDSMDLRYEVNANGQKETILRYSDDPASATTYQAIVDKYPDADLSFHLFGGASFTKTGKLYIPAEQIEKNSGKPYLYEITGGKITEQKATYSKDDEEFVVSTKKLGNYVVSDTKLKAGSSTADDEESSSEDESSSDVETIPNNPNEQINPDTGSKDIVAIAAVLAVVSLAAIGATTLKKRNKK